MVRKRGGQGGTSNGPMVRNRVGQRGTKYGPMVRKRGGQGRRSGWQTRNIDGSDQMGLSDCSTVNGLMPSFMRLIADKGS